MIETKRLSSHYVLLDFLADHDVYNSGKSLDLSQVLTDENLDGCEKFVEHLLGPLTEEYGPTSIAGGFWPEGFRTEKGHHKGPHYWTEQHGTAADVVFHDWVYENRPPFHLACEVDGSRIAYDRIISYAGSEFLCLSYLEGRNHKALRENIRLPDGRGKGHPYGNTEDKRPWRRGAPFPDRPDWRRAEGQGVNGIPGRFRAQHVRVGRYFVLLDFCRSVEGLRRGICTVPRIRLKNRECPQVCVSRMFAEVLDPVVGEFGRISVLRGMEPRPVSADADASHHRWDDSKSKRSRLVFLVPSDNRTKDIKDRLQQTRHVLSVESNQHDDDSDDSVEVAVTIEHFEPATIWTSAGNYTLMR